MVHTRGRLRARVLLGPDHLLRERRASPTVLHRPAEADETGAAEHLLPLHPDVEAEILVTRTAAAAQRGELPRHVVTQPRGHVTAELFVVGDRNRELLRVTHREAVVLPASARRAHRRDP